MKRSSPVAPTILYIHGAGASERSFAWLKDHLPTHHGLFMSYTTADSLADCIAGVTETLAQIAGPVTVIGHSLGGIIAAAVANNPNVNRIVTLSAPFGGHGLAPMLGLMIRESLLRDLNRYGPILRGLRETPITKPMRSIVTTHGLPFIPEPNDGVVTVSSQTSLNGIEYFEVSLNHFEVLLANETADLIREFVFESPCPTIIHLPPPQFSP